jgi:hypothetical protein
MNTMTDHPERDSLETEIETLTAMHKRLGGLAKASQRRLPGSRHAGAARHSERRGRSARISGIGFLA